MVGLKGGGNIVRIGWIGAAGALMIGLGGAVTYASSIRGNKNGAKDLGNDLKQAFTKDGNVKEFNALINKNKAKEIGAIVGAKNIVNECEVQLKKILNTYPNIVMQQDNDFYKSVIWLCVLKEELIAKLHGVRGIEGSCRA
jgi:hypothetical protein